MPLVSFLRLFRAASCAVALSLTATAALAQTGAPKPSEQQKPPGETAKDGQKSIDEIAEASRVLQGAAGNPECVWLGRRVVSLLWRDDLDTAFRHLDLYDRFGCPSSHIQATFRCVVRQGHIDPKAPESLNGRVHACWLNPALAPPPPPPAAPAPAAAGTGNR
ncbi:MAG TPA: beta-1-3, beta-1-6-glucan biosynthesis protein [Pseudolabrys sp.]|nr:beta-1-3, beta-1-6-glucan biosynthesis protein [Pseudolabrys sp.]